MRARGLSVDIDGFNAAMERQRAEARRAWAGSGEAATEAVWYALRERVGATEFLGYETETAEGVISAIVKDGVEVETLDAGERGSLILNQTPFYGESGGQVGDVGEITAPGFRAEVTDTRKKLGDLVVHDVDDRRGRGELRAWRSSFRSITTPARRRAPTIRRPISCMRRCAWCSAIMWRRRARWSRPSGCASTSPTRSRSRAPNSKRSRTSPTTWCWRTPR